MRDTQRAAGRPACEVGEATGLVGVAGFAAGLAISWSFGLPAGVAAPVLLLAAGAPMAVWAIAVEKTHRRASAGLDRKVLLPKGETLAIVRAKLIGLGATLAPLGLAAFALRSYDGPPFRIVLAYLALAAPIFLALAPVYLWWTTRRMVEPRDGLWHFGKLVAFQPGRVDREAVADHLRGWAIKGFFLAFMLSILPPMTQGVLAFDFAAHGHATVAAAVLAVQLLYLLDVTIGTVGYVATLRPLDAQLRSANPHLAAWVAAFACYPPLALMGSGGPLDYRQGTQDWSAWLGASPAALTLWAAALVALTAIYAWATVVFGLRFSNLTHRGVVTSGPYRFLKHPAYLSKNVFWWLVHMPFLSTLGPVEALRNCLLLLAVNAIYLARARTEEAHLRTDPRYAAYEAWIARAGLAARIRAGLAALGRHSERS